MKLALFGAALVLATSSVHAQPAAKKVEGKRIVVVAESQDKLDAVQKQIRDILSKVDRNALKGAQIRVEIRKSDNNAGTPKKAAGIVVTSDSKKDLDAIEKRIREILSNVDKKNLKGARIRVEMRKEEKKVVAPKKAEPDHISAIPLKFGKAEAVRDMIAELFDKEEKSFRMAADERTNLIILRGPGKLVKQISDVIKLVDVEAKK